MRYLMLAAGIIGAYTVLSPGQAAAQFPVKPVRVLAGGAAGGPIDIMSRVVFQKMSEQVGQTIVIDNRAGAGGTIATRLAAQASPDGYTLLCNSSQFVVAPSLYKQPGYDPFKDFAPIINAGVSPNIIFAHPSLNAKDLKELIAIGKAKPLSYGSAGAGSTPRFSSFRTRASDLPPSASIRWRTRRSSSPRTSKSKWRSGPTS